MNVKISYTQVRSIFKTWKLNIVYLLMYEKLINANIKSIFIAWNLIAKYRQIYFQTP